MTLDYIAFAEKFLHLEDHAHQIDLSEKWYGYVQNVNHQVRNGVGLVFGKCELIQIVEYRYCDEQNQIGEPNVSEACKAIFDWLLSLVLFIHVDL